MIKYLYGKSQHLGRFAETGEGLWFRDLFTMDKLENENISDNEAKKSIQLAPDVITKVAIAGREFKIVPNKPVTFSQTPRRCHVLCLSDKGNRKELFELFKADICIGINVVKLTRLIETANKHLGLEVIASSITYHEHENETLDLSQEQLVFVKPAEPYKRECEFRIAVFWPQNESSKLITETHREVNVFHANGAPDDHIVFSFESPAYEEVVHSITRT
ncbi:hypothetical protein AB4440_17850 [Vibrio splendidus]|uniref:hypothetical protein n=1 Tax=Vibrio splendidus TaxID=29497 RepID=UPI000C846EFD|nr:hypothetical protein [Vibrio splendidus]PMO94459.1 hypothetical protein BCS97_17285 [Vibrio splendidus]PMP33290.1 hypothetical protein BCS89_23720 [Vibrio splendidus]PMP33954.1 hypothetical protein BCS88_11955 [Vibrio splendidus]PMP45660.1 hypothetical protein BCS87_23655 [Vibrio splendidus]PMP45960.1 hypothetical protein BCS85_16275 [Vibrio splendidus]